MIPLRDELTSCREVGQSDEKDHRSGKGSTATHIKLVDTGLRNGPRKGYFEYRKMPAGMGKL